MPAMHSDSFPQKTILVIDDDASLHDLSRVVLTRIGYRYVSAFSGTEGLQRIKEHHPHMILLDLMMPDIDGEMLYKELISNPAYREFQNIPVIMLTALTHDDERKNKLLEMGISAYLNKPFGLNELINVIQNVFITHDIKLRNVRLQEEIKSANSYLERLINYAPVGILSTNREGIIIRVNSFFVQMMAAPDASMFIGKNILDYQLFKQEEICKKFEQVLKTGEPIKIPALNLQNARGWWIRANVNCVVLREDSNEISGLLSIWEDVTQIEKQTYELSILRQVGQALQRTLNLPELLHLILTSITAGCALGFSRAMVFLIDPEKNVLEGKVGVGPMSEEEARAVWNEISKDHANLEAFLEKYGTNIPHEESSFGKMVQNVKIPLTEENNVLVKTIREKKPFKIDNAWENPLVPKDFEETFQEDSFVTVPLSAKGRVIGIIVADNKYSEFPIEDDRVELLMLFANQAALAIENAEAYKKLEDKVAQLNEAFERLQEAQDRLLRSERLAVIGKMAAHVAHEIRNPLTAIGGFARRILEHPDDTR
ncbi:MAG TPA: response regulator, partial [Bacteroidetes bacterium]|nr:response regulator [Bacteroidota bacterium]